MSNLRRVGREAEDRAAEYLLGLGYTLVTRRFQARHGELDLVCLDGDTLVFVEVKARRVPGYVPEEAVGEAKIAALVRTAHAYLIEHQETRAARFDLIAIDPSGIRHHVDVFRG